jgi:hypothetical protein
MFTATVVIVTNKEAEGLLNVGPICESIFGGLL